MGALEEIIAELVGHSAAAEITASELSGTDSTEGVPDFEDPANGFGLDDIPEHNDRVPLPDDQQTEEQYEFGSSLKREYVNDINEAQKEFDRQNGSGLKYLYIDFTQNLNIGSKNRNDVYSEPLTEQFAKLRRRLSLRGKSIRDLNTFASVCFPRIESVYYVSLPGFERGIEKYSRGEFSAECVYNMVIRPEKTELVSAVIPDGSDIILIGDLVFRNSIITFAVKGIDLIDENVKKFGELKIKCAAACAAARDGRNRPDFGLETRELYNSFLTRDSVLSMCENVYPIAEPQITAAIFEEWKRYIGFRKYYLEVQSRRCERIDSACLLKAYSVSRSEYNKNKEEYSAHIPDGFEGFVRRDNVLLDIPVDGSAEFPLIRVGISRYLGEINAEPAGSGGISKFEKELRSFSRLPVALTANDPRTLNAVHSKGETVIYAGERAAFAAYDVEPQYDDIEDFYKKAVTEKYALIDLKYSSLVEAAVREYRKTEADKLRGKEKDIRERLDALCAEKKNELKKRLLPELEKEKREYKEAVEVKKQNAVSRKKEKFTRRHFVIYFKADTDIDSTKTDPLSKMRFLTYDNRAEKKKIERQEKAIFSFCRGYVRNPFLASYLFDPETLGSSEHEAPEPEWFRSGLNDTQKEAVRKAAASNSIFLLQGPPGTGKTEVISEITAQFVKQGKKVFISSETHKAIDNVFERLPKIPEIRPIRLIPAAANKESVYSPERLVDNLYLSISDTLQKRIRQYENLTEMRNSFGQRLEELQLVHGRMRRSAERYRGAQAEKNKLNRDVLEYDKLTENKRASKRLLEEEKERYESLLNCIDKRDFYADTEKSADLREIREHIRELISANSGITDITPERLTLICRLDIDEIRGELSVIENSGTALNGEREIVKIREKLRALRDPVTDDILPENEAEYARYRSRLIALNEARSENSGVDLSSFTVTRLVSADRLSDSAFRTELTTELIEIRNKISELLSSRKMEINGKLGELDKKIGIIDSDTADIRAKRADIIERLGLLEQDEAYAEHSRISRELRRSVAEFFSELEINEEYPAGDLTAAIEIISKRLGELDEKSDALEKEMRTKMPLYRSISAYLQNEDILENDRISYTKKLFDNANVFGMTCTSREYFSEASLPELREYNLGDINIRNVGIDVVIIDEVSKSSFPDLLIPILYGKTVILVGDHRQLPPLYDLKHLKERELEGLDPEMIDLGLNGHYRELYEKCFFKELFERVPDRYRIMLDRQYRCHSDIMDVFNHFYGSDGKGLSVGISNQNDLKQHGLRIRANGMTLIEPEDHICFINCTEYESRLDSESPSIINRQEAEVVCRLLSLMDEQYGRMAEDGEIRRDKRRDGRKGVGVICTYRDQARQIKNSLKGVRFRGFSEKREEKLIISTVDDFQGDERDIIIVSMVRNPKGSRYSTEFIDRFERINVALSRARCLLVIVGSQEFLSKSSIDLPDINGRKELDKHSFPVYREIIRTIQAKGRMLQAADIIGEMKKNG